MTGNTNKWRAPLAGLASLAMLATMGVAATTANAATPEASLAQKTVTFNLANGTKSTLKVPYGESVADVLAGTTGNPYWTPASYTAGATSFAGWNYDFNKAVTTDDVNVTAVESVASGKDLVQIKFEGVYSAYGTSRSSTQPNFFFPDGTTGTSYYVKAGTKLADRVPVDVKDGKVVTKWSVDDGQNYKNGYTTTNLADLDVNNPTGGVITIKPAAYAATTDVKTVTVKGDSTGTGYPLGANTDGNTADNDYIIEAAKNTTVKAPAGWVFGDASRTAPQGWKYSNGTPVAFGGDVTVGTDDVTLYPSEKTTTEHVVTFKDNTGKIVKTATAKQDNSSNLRATLLAPADQEDIANIKIDGYTVKGWKLQSGTVADTDTGLVLSVGTTFNKDTFKTADFQSDATFVAVPGGTTGTVKVTFRDANYYGNNKNVVVDAKGGTYLSSDKFPSWTRDGYVFAGWYLSDATGNVVTPKTELDTNSLIGDNAFAKDFTVVATWEKVSANVLDAALAYLPNDPSYADYFTSETWDNYKSVYQKVVNEKNALVYGSTDDKVSDADAAKLVTELKAGWEQLKFNAEGNPSISALDKDKNSFVFRLHKDGLRLYSQTPSEIYAAQRTGWTVDNGYLFRAAAKDAQKSTDVRNLKSFENAAGQVVKGSNAQAELASKLDAIADPIVTVIERYSSPNGKDWVYTSNATEMKSLDRGGWNNEQIAFVTPTFGGTPVVRFAKGGQHLMSTGATEQASLVRNGWTREGVAFRGL